MKDSAEDRGTFRPTWLAYFVGLLVCMGTTAAVVGAAGDATKPPPLDVEGLGRGPAEQVRALHEAVLTTLEDESFSSRERAEAVGEIGRFYHALGRSESAEKCYVLARRLDPEDYRWPYYLGVLLESEERLEDAAAAFEATLTIRPEVAALMRLAQVYEALGRPEAAARNARQAVRFDPRATRGEFDDPLIDGLVERAEERALLLQGRVAFGVGRLEEASGAFEQALEVQPDSVAGLVNLGLTMAALGRSEEAIASFERAVEVAPDDPAPRLQLGLQLAAQGELALAKTHLESAVALAPDDPTARTELAAVLWHAGDAESALEHYRGAISLNPNLERPRLGEAQVLQAQGRYAEARERLEEAHALLPSSGLVAYGLAWVLATSPQPDVRDGAQALELAQDIFQVRHRIEDAILVAAALGALDRCTEAEQMLTGITERAEEAGATEEVLDHLRRRVELFGQGPPCLLPPSGRVE